MVVRRDATTPGSLHGVKTTDLVMFARRGCRNCCGFMSCGVSFIAAMHGGPMKKEKERDTGVLRKGESEEGREGGREGERERRTIVKQAGEQQLFACFATTKENDLDRAQSERAPIVPTIVWPSPQHGKYCIS